MALRDMSCDNICRCRKLKYQTSSGVQQTARHDLVRPILIEEVRGMRLRGWGSRIAASLFGLVLLVLLTGFIYEQIGRAMDAAACLHG